MASVQKRSLEEDENTAITPTKKAKSIESFKEEFKCTICQDVIYQPTTLECGHNFCLTCVYGLDNPNVLGLRYCPNCRIVLDLKLENYKKNIFMENLMNKLGGEDYQAICQEREMDKLADRVRKKFYSSQLCKLISNQIDQELKNRTSISYSELTEKLKSMFGSKYEYAIISVLIYSYHLLDDQIIGRGYRLLNFMEQKENLTNDQLIYLIQSRYQSPKEKPEIIELVKMLKLYQPTTEFDKLNFLELKHQEIPAQRGRLEVLSELEELIDIHNGRADEEEE